MGTINSPHSRDETFKKIRAYFEEKKPMDNLGVAANVEFDNAKKMVLISGKGFDGKITILENSVDYSFKLGLLFKPLKGKIEEFTEKYINRALET